MAIGWSAGNRSGGADRHRERWSRRRGSFATGGRRRAVALVAAAVPLAIAVGLGVWGLLPSTTPAPRARQYLAFTACLLTDGQGLADVHAALVWAGMQDASLATRAKVQFLPAAGAVTASDAAPYVASLVQRRCDLIVAVGGPPVAAVVANAARYPKTRFVTVGGAASAANLSTVAEMSTAGMRQRIDVLVRAAIRR